jgi:hypothetical protein
LTSWKVDRVEKLIEVILLIMETKQELDVYGLKCRSEVAFAPLLLEGYRFPTAY